MLTHPNSKSNEKTLRDFLLEVVPNIKDWGEEYREGIVHRLDRVTSGLIVCAINHETYTFLKNEFKDRKVNKKYLAIVQGNLSSDSGKIELPIKRSESNRSKRSIGKNGRLSISEYEVIKKNSGYSLISINLITGRNHQIRAQMEYLNTPVVNDTLYGAESNKHIPPNAISVSYTHLTLPTNREV